VNHNLFFLLFYFFHFFSFFNFHLVILLFKLFLIFFYLLFSFLIIILLLYFLKRYHHFFTFRRLWNWWKFTLRPIFSEFLLTFSSLCHLNSFFLTPHLLIWFFIAINSIKNLINKKIIFFFSYFKTNFNFIFILDLK
jgi:hypothetical protein